MPSISDLAPQQFAYIPFELRRFNAIAPNSRAKLSLYDAENQRFALPKFYGLRLFERKEIVHQIATQDDIQRRIAGLILQVSAEEGHDINQLAQVLIEQTSAAHKVALFAKHIDEVLAIQRTAESLSEDVLLVTVTLKFRGATNWDITDTLNLPEGLFSEFLNYCAQDRDGWGNSEGNDLAEGSPLQSSEKEQMPQGSLSQTGKGFISTSKKKGKRFKSS